jgi:hypothetical protein
MHEPLSQSLARMIDSTATGDGVSLNELLDQTGGRGFYLVVILLALPFVLPVSIAGVSTVLGLAVAFLSFKLGLGASPRLPAFLGRKKLSPEVQRKVLRGGIKVLRVVERLVKPRRSPWMTARFVRFHNAMLMTFMGLLLAMPFPPLPPLTNALPCYCIILLAASMMEEDGVTIWFAYALSLGTVVYLGLNVFVILEAAKKAVELFRRWFE